jgi:hypothetical protein
MPLRCPKAVRGTALAEKGLQTRTHPAGDEVLPRRYERAGLITSKRNSVLNDLFAGSPSSYGSLSQSIDLKGAG